MTNKRKKSIWSVKFGKIIIFALIVAYIIMFLYTFFAQKVETVIMVEGKIERKDTAEAIITRSEKVVTSDVAGILYPEVTAGERVAKGQKVAVVKGEAAKEIEKSISELKDKMGKLVTPKVFSNDVKILDSEINTILLEIMKDEYYQNFNNIGDLKDIINLKLQKKAQVIGKLSPKGSVESNYINQLAEYESKMDLVQAELNAPIAGTVVYKVDGYEDMLKPEAISKYTEESLNKLNISKGELVGTVQENGFKIVDNIECYITVILDSKDALNADVDQKVKLGFPEISKDLITGQIDYLTIENTGKAAITFRINRGIEDLINYRKVKTEVIWETVEGRKVPINAISKKDGANKIFILAGRNYIVEKSINILCEWDGYAIIEATEGNKLSLYDNVILHAEEVNKNKLLFIK